jgi:hypothetical protein
MAPAAWVTLKPANKQDPCQHTAAHYMMALDGKFAPAASMHEQTDLREQTEGFLSRIRAIPGDLWDTDDAFVVITCMEEGCICDQAMKLQQPSRASETLPTKVLSKLYQDMLLVML